MAKGSKVQIHGRILEALRRQAPGGLSIHEIRALLPAEVGPQEQLDRRIRDLRTHHKIAYQDGKYIYEGERDAPVDNLGISGRLRAAVLSKAHGRCQMCGRTVQEDGVKLQADHKIPRSWGGATELDNLWAICEACNNGKRDFFSSLNSDEMERLVRIDSVHARLAEGLRLRGKDGVPSWFLEFVANVNDFQEDWQRRLRELRVLGIDYEFKKSRLPSGKVQTTYTLTKWTDLPHDATGVVRQREGAKRRAK
jgi:hypothetical protein